MPILLGVGLAACQSNGDSSSSGSGGGGGSTPRYAIGGTVSGLRGSGLVLEDNGGDDLAPSADGRFAFATKLSNATGYAVTVKAQPTGPSQTCVVESGVGSVGGADVTNIVVTCTTNAYGVGGTVSGLSGTLVLQDELGDDLTVNADGPFTFGTLVSSGDPFSVTVKAQPANQTCVVAGGSGTVIGGDVSTITVNCTTLFAVTGTVVGLVGDGLKLRDNGEDEIAVAALGEFAFRTLLADGATYAVTVSAQPSGQRCAVTNGSGTIDGADPQVSVTCVSYWELSGSVAGLIVGSVVLEATGGGQGSSVDVTVDAVDGPAAFTFGSFPDQSTYGVAVKTQPSAALNLTCGTSGTTSGTLTANVTNLAVACSCSSGYGDCDGQAADGCETPTNTVANCGGCGNACAPDHGIGACSSGGQCTVAGCFLGFGDCNNEVSDGCETDLLTDPDHCGSCLTGQCAPSPLGRACVNGTCGCNAASDCPPSQACNLVTHRCGTSCGNAGQTGCNGGCCNRAIGTCVAGTADSACGNTGALCVACGGGAPSCVGGGCN